MHSNFNLPRGIYMANLTRLFIRDLPVFLQFSSLIIFFDLTCFILFYLEYKFDLILRFYACIQWNVNIFTLFSLLQQPMYSTQYILTPKFIFIMLAYKVPSVLLVWSWVWDHSLNILMWMSSKENDYSPFPCKYQLTITALWVCDKAWRASPKPC